MKKYIGEFIGTAVLVLFGTGIAVVSGGNLVATALAFGLSIVAMAYVIGNISGCHINPAVSLAMLINKDILIDLLIFKSTYEDKYVTLKEYISRMKDGQKDIYYASGESPEKIKELPQIEKLLERDR